MITSKAPKGLTTENIADLLTSYKSKCNLRSSSRSSLAISWSNLETEGDLAFSVQTL